MCVCVCVRIFLSMAFSPFATTGRDCAAVYLDYKRADVRTNGNNGNESHTCTPHPTTPHYETPPSLPHPSPVVQEVGIVELGHHPVVVHLVVVRERDIPANRNGSKGVLVKTNKKNMHMYEGRRNEEGGER